MEIKKYGILIVFFVWSSMMYAAVREKKGLVISMDEMIEKRSSIALSWKERLGLWVLRKSIQKEIKRKETLQKLKTECQEKNDCYRILLKKEKIIYARDIRIKHGILHYQYCNKAHRHSKIRLENILQVYDLNGQIIYKNENPAIEAEKKLETFGLLSFVIVLLALFSIPLFSIPLFLLLIGASFILAISSIIRFRKNRGIYKGITFPIITLLVLLILGIGIIYFLTLPIA